MWSGSRFYASVKSAKLKPELFSCPMMWFSTCGYTNPIPAFSKTLVLNFCGVIAAIFILRTAIEQKEISSVI